MFPSRHIPRTTHHLQSDMHQLNEIDAFKTQKKKVYLLTVVNPVIWCVRAIASPNPLSTQSRIV